MARTGPMDPDVDAQDPARRRRRTVDPAALGVIAVGGVLGSEARYALGLAAPHASGSWPVATLVINVSGSLVLGALMVVLTELTSPHRLIRPFLGVGVLGGYTTFSTAMVDAQELLRAGRPAVAMAYLAGTALAALLAAALGVALVRGIAAAWIRRRRRRETR
jgi:CrcB protein